MEDDWDLHAVVRGCAAICTTTTSTSAAAGEFTSTTSSHGRVFSTLKQNCTSFKDLFEPRRESFVQELHELYRPFFPSSEESSSLKVIPSQNLPISPLSVLGGLQDLPSEHQQKQQQQQHLQIMKQLPPPTHLQQKQQAFSVANCSPKKASVISHPPPPRSKRRKNNLKRVCHVAAENLSSDMWSWRKYGQKPIKGSPYPRGYYRCSTSKGCMARKQVERNRSDPGMFIVTYTAEHNHPIPAHRNSLAGSTRNKQPETPSSDDPSKPTSSSPATEKTESSRDDDLAEAAADEDDDEFSISEMALDEDFFAGLEDLTATDSGDCFSGHSPVQLPWLSTITGGG
ncbi:hypothetical protein ABFS83_02G168100 [Erythranthe nasuta]